MADNLNSLTHLPGFMLRRAANAMMGELSQLLADIDLRVTDSTILLLIDGREDLTASQIGRTLDIQRANMVPILTRLEEQGLVVRKALDGKSQAIVLSEAGEKKAAQARKIVDDFEESLLTRIPEQHRDHLAPALNALLG